LIGRPGFFGKTKTPASRAVSGNSAGNVKNDCQKIILLMKNYSFFSKNPITRHQADFPVIIINKNCKL